MGISSKGLTSRPPFVNRVNKISAGKGGSKEIMGELKQYYSQVDAELFFGTQYIDDVLALNYQIEQATLPLQGYNSWTVDEFVQGSRRLSGSFAINFTSPGYLNRILEAITEEEKKLSGIKPATLWPIEFEIDIVYGQKTKENKNPAHIVFSGVKIIGTGSMVHGGVGQPIMEQYNFVAKDIVTYD